jgi:CheY-like chemotaxis protein
VQINPLAGITFSAGLRSILRQDPDIVMVGEIRDSETASIAFQAGQTGHLVLSTLHTNDAPSAVTRLLDLGVPSFLISASLIAVIGQRLVRKICPECKKPDPLTPQILKQLAPYVAGREEVTFWKGIGCEACQYSGYSGRQGIFEILMLNASLKRAIEPEVSAQLLQGIAEEDGYKPMSEDGIEKALQGLTTVEEVYRVAPIEDVDSRVTSHRQSATVPFIAPLQQVDDLPKSGIAGPHFRKILIADDSPVTLRLLRNFLEAENYQVMTANNGSEAYKLAIREKPDLVITDYIMPEMDGLALTMKLKAQPMTRYIPIIILTVKDDEDSEVAALASGADDYIKKPFSAGTLLARVGKVLNRPVSGEGESWATER